MIKTVTERNYFAEALSDLKSDKFYFEVKDAVKNYLKLREKSFNNMPLTFIYYYNTDLKQVKVTTSFAQDVLFNDAESINSEINTNVLFRDHILINKNKTLLEKEMHNIQINHSSKMVDYNNLIKLLRSKIKKQISSYQKDILISENDDRDIESTKKVLGYILTGKIPLSLSFKFSNFDNMKDKHIYTSFLYNLIKPGINLFLDYENKLIFYKNTTFLKFYLDIKMLQKSQSCTPLYLPLIKYISENLDFADQNDRSKIIYLLETAIINNQTDSYSLTDKTRSVLFELKKKYSKDVKDTEHQIKQEYFYSGTNRINISYSKSERAIKDLFDVLF